MVRPDNAILFIFDKSITLLLEAACTFLLSYYLATMRKGGIVHEGCYRR